MNPYLITRKLSLLACAGLLSLGVGAETIKVDIKPGLWEYQSKLSSDSADQLQKEQAEQMKKAMAEMKSRLAQMPPEQRKMMENMMAKQGMKITEDGMSMQNDKVQVNREGARIKQCITQAQIDKGFTPKAGENCQSTMTKAGKNKYAMKYVCTGEDKVNGEGEFELVSDKEYRGHMHMNSLVQGKPHVVEADMQGHWLGSDCGDIEPDEDD